MKSLKVILFSIALLLISNLVVASPFDDVASNEVRNFIGLSVPEGGVVTYSSLAEFSLDPNIPVKAIYGEAQGYKQIAEFRRDYEGIYLYEKAKEIAKDKETKIGKVKLITSEEETNFLDVKNSWPILLCKNVNCLKCEKNICTTNIKDTIAIAQYIDGKWYEYPDPAERYNKRLIVDRESSPVTDYKKEIEVIVKLANGKYLGGNSIIIDKGSKLSPIKFKATQNTEIEIEEVALAALISKEEVITIEKKEEKTASIQKEEEITSHIIEINDGSSADDYSFYFKDKRWWIFKGNDKSNALAVDSEDSVIKKLNLPSTYIDTIAALMKAGFRDGVEILVKKAKMDGPGLFFDPSLVIKHYSTLKEIKKYNGGSDAVINIWEVIKSVEYKEYKEEKVSKEISQQKEVTKSNFIVVKQAPAGLGINFYYDNDKWYWFKGDRTNIKNAKEVHALANDKLIALFGVDGAEWWGLLFKKMSGCRDFKCGISNIQDAVTKEQPGFPETHAVIVIRHYYNYVKGETFVGGSGSDINTELLVSKATYETKDASVS